MKKIFNHDKGKVETLYQEGDIVNMEAMLKDTGGLFMSPEGVVKLNDTAVVLYNLITDAIDPPITPQELETLLTVLEYKILLLNEEDGFDKLRQDEII